MHIHPQDERGGTMTGFAFRKSNIITAIAVFVGLLATMVGIQPASAQPGQEDSIIRSTVTYIVMNTYKVTSKGSSEPNTAVSVQYASGEEADLYAETRKGLTAYDAEFADYKDLRSRLVKVGTSTKPIDVVKYRGQNLTNGHDAVSDFSIETAMGHEALGGLDWTNVSQPSASYYGGVTPKGVRLRVTTTSTCTVSYPLNRAEVCSKRTESLSVKNIGRTKVKLALESQANEYASDEPPAELPTVAKKLKRGKTWNIEFMTYYGGGDFHYLGESYPMFDDSSYELIAGSNSVVAGKYGYGASDASPWWWKVYSNADEADMR